MKQFCRLAKAHTFLSCLVLAAVLLVSVVAGIGFGPVSIPFSQVWQVMLHRLGGLLTGSALRGTSDSRMPLSGDCAYASGADRILPGPDGPSEGFS